MTKKEQLKRWFQSWFQTKQGARVDREQQDREQQQERERVQHQQQQEKERELKQKLGDQKNIAEKVRAWEQAKAALRAKADSRCLVAAVLGMGWHILTGSGSVWIYRGGMKHAATRQSSV